MFRLTTRFAALPVLSIRPNVKTYITNDKSLAVMRPFPGTFKWQDSDPFLLCDIFGPTGADRKARHEDDFPIDWHPHRGMDLLTYIIEGSGRHADSMGNRETFKSPGMQWISAGSGVYHAEGGANDVSERYMGFQIWVNVPTANKMDDPRYGTVPPEQIPTLTDDATGVTVRVLAGPYGGVYGDVVGPFQTVADVQIIDVRLPRGGSTFTHPGIPECMDNVLVVCYRGHGFINPPSATARQSTSRGADDDNHDDKVENAKAPLSKMATNTVAHLDASDDERWAGAGNRSFHLAAADDSDEGAGFLVFAGKRLNEPVAWDGAIVMSLKEDLDVAVKERKEGTLLRKRVPWDYRKIAEKPK